MFPGAFGFWVLVFYYQGDLANVGFGCLRCLLHEMSIFC